MNNIKYKKYIILLLLIVPALYIFMGFFFHSERAYYFMYSTDPEYCYLFNGINLAQYTLKVWHVDHPGTPIQFLTAIVIRVVHLFRSNEPFLKDIMQNSALYAKAVNITMFSITALLLFILGILALKFTKSIIQSIFLQLTPFVSYLVLTLVFRINTENMAVMCFIMMGILIIKYLGKENTSSKLIDKYFIGFSVVAGFSMAVKITFFPILFIPLFLFKGFFRKILYCVFSVFAFLIFISPVLLYRFRYFYYWIKDLIIHSGQYGGGKANIIDKGAYLNALKLTFTTEYFFTISFLVFLLAVIIYQIPYVKIKVRNDKLYKLLLGISVSMIMMILLVAKQYKYHYLTPALLPISFGIWIVVLIFFNKFKVIYKNIIFLILIFIIISFDFIKTRESHSYYLMIKESLFKTLEFINKNPTDKPLVIVPTYYGCAYHQYSLYFGMYWGGEIMRPRYAKVIHEIYPKTYNYNWTDELFHDWFNNPNTYIDLLKKYGSIRLYTGDSIIENNVIKHVMFNIKRANDTKIEKVFSNINTNENIYDIKYIPPLLNLDSIKTVCNADSLTSDRNYFKGSNGQLFTNNNTQSSEQAFSGKYSCKLSGNNKQGMTYFIGEVSGGDHYKVSIWRNNNNKNASLVVSARDGDDFYIEENKTVIIKNNWSQIIIDFVVPKKMNNKEIHIYAYNGTGKPAYFDDIIITLY